jgi:hypothetical protein
MREPRAPYALTVVAGPFFDTRREKLVALAVRHAMPTMYHFREFAVPVRLGSLADWPPTDLL